MDDLLSVALSEAGLDEFLTPVLNSPTENGCIPLASSSTPEGSYAPSTSSLSPSGVPSGISTTPSPAVTPASNIQSDIFEDSLSNCQSIQGTSTQSQSQTVSASTTAPLSTTNIPTNSVQNMGRVQLQSQQFTYEKSCATPPTPPIAGGVQVRTSYTTAPLSGGQAIKRIVQTPDGPKTQLLRPYVNEKGQTIYRAVRTVPVISGVAARTFSVSGTSGNPTRVVVNRSTGGTTVIDQNGHPQRIVVVRQNTPSGPVLVRKAIPAGSSVTTSSSGRGGTIIRRVVTRGGQQMEIAAQPTSTFSDRNIINVKGSRTTSPSSHSQVHVETGHQYASTLSPPPISRVSSTPSVRGLSRNNINRGSSIRGATVYRPLTQPSSQLLSRTSGGGYSTVSSRPVSLGYSASSPNLHSTLALGTKRPINISGKLTAQYTNNPIQQGHEYVAPDQMIYDQDTVFREVPQPVEQASLNPRPHPALVGSVSSTLQRQKMANKIHSVRSAAGAESLGTLEHMDIKRVQSPGPGRPTPKPATPTTPVSMKLTTKSQKAKDEMKSAMQTAAEKRAEIDEEEENLGYAETYAEYRPAKLRSGLAHPDCVVETASLSSVAPPDVRYQISIPEYLIDTGAVSALQLEAVIYACQMHEQRLPSGERTGYLIGDGAGVGKGRTVACIIFENYLLGRKRAIWLSVSSDLKFDSERDLRDIGAGNIKVYALNKLKYAKISGKENGHIKKGVVFATYSSLIGECRTAKSKYRSRLKQLIQWFGVDYDGVIILDECHRAKNLVPTAGSKPTKTGRMVLELQKALPNARVVYASATGATEPRNMAYMTRIGLWGPGQAFPEFSDFIEAVEKRGVGAMEIVAMDMKQRGLYLARQLSFRGVSFIVQEVPLSEEFIKVYDDSVKLWMECRRQFQAVLNTMTDEERSGCKQVWGQFWACHQRFFKYLCIGAKVDACVQMAREAIKTNKCVVIGLQSTGEARTLETLEEMGGELTEFVSTSKAVLQGLIEKHFPSERGSTDIFRDFDKMFDDFDRPRKRKLPRNPMGFDVLDELGLGLGHSKGSPNSIIGLPGPSAKRLRRSSSSDQNSTTSSSGDEDDGTDSGLNDEDDIECSDEDVNIGDNDEDWLKALLAEAASSSESDDDDDDDDDDGKDDDSEPNEGVNPTDEQRSNGEDEFNPFACDFSQDDPWASKQQVIEESPKKKIRMEKSPEELEEIRLRRRARRKKRKKRMKREAARNAEFKKRREIASEAMKSTATDFITSSRFIDNCPDSINPQMIKAELLAAVERLGPQLPANTLDQLIDELGGPEFVAEMTGRKGRVVTREDGEIEYELRHAGADVPLELMNMDEKDKFMKGDKMVAVISEAASSGISLQSDRRAPNKRRRVHITLELPWSADKAIQQFGRTHRSNQVSAPEYVFLISELAGEKRFASIVAKRLESLGALTHGDRRATESRDLSQFNLDTKYGRAALEVLLKSIIGSMNPPLIPPPSDYKPGNFFEDMRLYMEGVGLLTKQDTGSYIIEREAATIAKFLNRILGLPVHAQNALFFYFTEIVNELIAQAKHDGTYDMGIMDLGTGGDQVRKLETRVFLGRVEKGSFRVEMHKIGVERGVSWDDAFAIYKEHSTNEDGFYVSNSGGSGRKVAALVYGIGKRRLDTGARLYAITRPSTGRSPKLETFNELSKRFSKVEPEQAKKVWEDQYEGASKSCQHSYVHGKCKNEAAGVYCEVGRRTRTYFVLSGSVLSVWPVVEEVLSDRDRRPSRMQVIRVRTDQDQKIVGLLVLPQFVRTLVARLEDHCGRCYVEAKKEEKKY